MIRIDFLELWKLIRDLEQIRKHLFSKNKNKKQMSLTKNCKLCGI